MGTQLNKNILVFDVDMGLDKALLELGQASQPPDYIVLRRPRPEAGRFWFYVFRPEALLEYLKATAGQVQNGVFPDLRDSLPQLHETDSAPTVPASITLPRWSDRYDATSWIGLGYPVAISNNQPAGVWEQAASATRPATPSPPSSPTEHNPPSILERLGVDTETVHRGGLGTGTFSDVAGNVDFSQLIETGGDSRSVTRGGDMGFESVDRSAGEESAAGASGTGSATASNKMQEVFPAIDASNKHPVVGEAITLTVSLKVEKDQEVGGGVVLPVAAADFVFKLDVHLQCGKESLWDTLEYSQQGGTTKAAAFTFTAPDVTPDENGNYPDREKLPVVVNFYYENRWSGEGQRYLDLRIDDTVSVLRRMPVPPESHWSKLIYLEQGAQPPDLLVRIAKAKSGEREYHWVCLSPHLQLDNSLPGNMTLPASAAEFTYDLFEQYSRTALNEVKVNEIHGIGEEIYDSTPEVFKSAYWSLYELSRTRGGKPLNNILFVTDEPYIPWELMRVADQQRGPNVAAEFLCIRHAVGRWVADCSSRLPQQIPVHELVACGSTYVGYDAVYPTLPWVKDELEWLETNYHAKTVPLKSADVISFLKSGTAQAVHFACHGQMDHQNPLRSQLIMEDSPDNLRPTVISAQEVEMGLGKAHPLVFLNACQVGSAGASLSLMAGFPGAFLKAGASAVISPLWTISDEHAKAITEAFYQAAFANPGATLGEIMQGIHKQWADKQHLTFLAYVLYGDPQARVAFQPN